MASFAWRQATKEATLQSIARREAAITTPTYADILTGRTAHPKPDHAVTPLSTPQQLTNLNKPLIPTATPLIQDPIEEGWTTVTRKRKVRLPKQLKHPAKKLNKHTAALKAEGRCYKCLDRGHTQFQCRNGVKCHNCHGIGHISARCNFRKKEAISTPPAAQAFHHHTEPKSKTPHTPQPTDMPIDLENWESIPMLSPDLIQNRAPELNVFFPTQ